MANKCVCGAVGELPIASLGTGLQRAFTAISPNTTTACMGRFKLAVSTAAALQSLYAATPSPQPTVAVPTRPTPEKPSARTLGSQLWTGKLSVRQNLQAQWLELLMVLLCPNQVTTVVMIVHNKRGGGGAPRDGEGQCAGCHRL